MTKTGNSAAARDVTRAAHASNSSQADSIVTQLVETRSWLRSMQNEAERQRRIPQETVERLDRIGLYRLATPSRFGGADFSSRDLFRIYEALGSGCGATAWTLWASAGGNQWSTAFSDAVVKRVYDAPWIGNRTCNVGGSTRRLSGSARQVNGGWMIKGVWPFATGSVHASHAYLAVFYDDVDDSKVGMVLVPKESYVLREDWDVIGLAATGSGTIVVEEELFVSDDHFSSPALMGERFAALEKRGQGPRPGGLGRSVVVGAGNAVGMAEHALEEFLEGIGKKAIAYSPYSRQVEAPVTHLNVGAVKMQINAARGVAEAALDELDRLYETGEASPPADLVRYQAYAGYIWDTCATAVETLFKASGASGIARKQPLQLIARNCRAGSMHAAHNIQTCTENYGRQLCGVMNSVTSVNVLERAG